VANGENLTGIIAPLFFGWAFDSIGVSAPYFFSSAFLLATLSLGFGLDQYARPERGKAGGRRQEQEAGGIRRLRRKESVDSEQ
jgi:hypothetical protein